ncbi:hypothetical protein GCM10009789_05640 [Kribbella sancticallisti]|uniref:Uncharacterized protein n=1 Tax=Kribbella sancticallisti TaxID=460087 RepID=A0ABN2C9W4_9ACTN
METDPDAAWRPTCTPRSVVAGEFRQLNSPGLMLVRLDLTGIAGEPGRLRELVVAVQLLRRARLLVDYELDLFGGSPRFATIRENLAVLRAIVADGTTAATFTIRPTDGQCSPWVDEYRERLKASIGPWLTRLSDELADDWAEVVMGERQIYGPSGVAAHRIALQRLTLRSNTELLNLVADSAREFELTGDTRLLDDEFVRPRITLLTESMLALRNRFLTARAAAQASAAAPASAQAAKNVVPLRRVG